MNLHLAVKASLCYPWLWQDAIAIAPVFPAQSSVLDTPEGFPTIISEGGHPQYTRKAEKMCLQAMNISEKYTWTILRRQNCIFNVP